MQVCVAREVTKLADPTSPVVRWLRPLAASAYRECGGPGVGVVGMCFTGGFALATALEPSVVASVVSQPAMVTSIAYEVPRGRSNLGEVPDATAAASARLGQRDHPVASLPAGVCH